MAAQYFIGVLATNGARIGGAAAALVGTDVAAAFEHAVTVALAGPVAVTVIFPLLLRAVIVTGVELFTDAVTAVARRSRHDAAVYAAHQFARFR